MPDYFYSTPAGSHCVADIRTVLTFITVQILTHFIVDHCVDICCVSYLQKYIKAYMNMMQLICVLISDYIQATSSLASLPYLCIHAIVL